MIALHDIGKTYETRHGPRDVLRHVSLRIDRGSKVGFLGSNGAGKSTLIRIISGAERPTTGRIERRMSVSWPLAFGGAFQGSLTGLDNLRFICRVYGVSTEDKIEFVQDFAELGRYFREPVKNYSSGMRARLAFAISMVVEFDCFLVDEIIAVGDSRFQAKCMVELFEKRADRALIMASHQAEFVRQYCQHAAVLTDGRLHYFDKVDDALDFHASAQAQT
jgi:capsular polysaccharide transport system ATP-binding protein